MDIDPVSLQVAIREVIEEMGITQPSEIAARWQGGTMVLKPSNDSQPKEVPLETFFKKIIGVRDALRVLEQKINGHKGLSETEKLSLQTYISRCYGSLTTFNVLFKHGPDRFVGTGTGAAASKEPASQASASQAGEKLTVGQARKKIGMGEY